MKEDDIFSETKNLDDVEIEDSFNKQALTAIISPLSDEVTRSDQERARSQ